MQARDEQTESDNGRRGNGHMAPGATISALLTCLQLPLLLAHNFANA